MTLISFPLLGSSSLPSLLQVNDVNNQISASLESLGGRGGEVEGRGWPVTGGEVGEGGGPSTLIVTGHEDGSVKFWMSRDNLLTHLTTLATGKFFRGEDDFDDDLPRDDDEEDEWPPFRKVGSFDPYSDDPRLAVKKLLFCGETGILVVGGTAGQVKDRHAWNLSPRCTLHLAPGTWQSCPPGASVQCGRGS